MGSGTHIDREGYQKFTPKMRLSKAIHTLEGILVGMHIDGSINAAEVNALRGWVDRHRDMARKHPMSEIIPKLDEVLADGKLDDEEMRDVLWMCGRLRPESHFYRGMTAQMQQLQGILGGIVADGRIDDREIEELRKWVGGAAHTKSIWPYDEIESLLTQVMADGTVTEEERKLLITFLSEFTTVVGDRAVSFPMNEIGEPITGLCAVCPEVSFYRKMFCFTGSSNRFSREMLSVIVNGLGGIAHPRVTADVNYLVIGADGNPCWAFSCYGRKVEQAIEMRKAGSSITLVHENDFWDAVAANGGVVPAVQ